MNQNSINYTLSHRKLHDLKYVNEVKPPNST